MKIAVVYASKTGFTKKYALLLKEALKADCFELNQISQDRLKDYELIVFGGGLYVGGINGLKHFRRETMGRDLSRMAFFATGATPARDEVVPEITQINFQKGEQLAVKLFYLRGGFNFKHLTLLDKVLMTLLKLKIKVKAEANRSVDERGMLAAYGHPADFTKSHYLDPLVACVKEMQGE